MHRRLALATLPLLAVRAWADTVVAEWSGAGAMTTRPLTFSGPWEFQWTAKGLFLAHLIERGSMKASVLASQTGAGPGVTRVAQGGTWFIAINAQAPWTARAVLVGP